MTRRAIFILASVVAISLIFVFGVSQCQRAQNASTAAKVAKGQAGAAIESGGDAADTVGNRMAADAKTDAITQENRNAIQNAEGASAPVAAPVRDAGLASLCRRAAYRGDTRCVQPPPSR
ncbi:hypothetical protein CA223_06885 [Sphingomonas koreensis]|uniref:Uncharacterized protein n=1 Tax=Sphingomonas koreensis TaxID=93064 RepID=A0A1L6J7U0_9SPHN|nr:hypothetical protein [Sphingomonas koreensis]APR51978.1 hypothetical protein BRX40_05595 [Sphingomonas koreensis]RSU22780.1 hypothetical protein CA224_05215 [Sphingomonas koreensis]RSU30745.1 hypothetical protein CA222_01330 [Sphingomonas koreensis]RSU31840.1 hypothetical protein CA225_00410 [Sphingomonas koreensis]RSU39238.1 hypothetical protein BRX39_01120 [Sphingomonas koreensis]